MTETRQNTAAFGLAMLCVLAILFHFHDQFWWPVDEGVYAYVAQRANAGDVIHRDVIDLHGGYGNILNALAFKVFGEDLLSLRYPLVLITLLQCLITFALLKRCRAFAAFAGTITVAAFSFVQFPNPSANWHALTMFFCLCLCLEAMPRGSATRLLVAGFIVGMCFFTRQLSGVFLALGLLCVLLAEASSEKPEVRGPALFFGGVSFAGLLIYLTSKQHLFGMIWGGIWPLCLLVFATLRADVPWREAGKITALVLSGFILSGLPLAVLAFSMGAFSYWMSDILFAALMINGQEFIAQASYLNILKLALQNITGAAGLVGIVSAVAWAFLILCIPVFGAYSCIALYRAKTVPPSAILAVFWVLGGLHYQIPIYLLFVLPATLFAMLKTWPKPALSTALVVLSVWALIFQAAQPLERGLAGTVAGQRGLANIPSDLPRVSLKLQAQDIEIYRQIIAAIEKNARIDEALMTLPMDPELNFMTGRKSPVRYYGTPLGLREEGDIGETLTALEASAPLFVVHRRQDKYLSELSAKLLEQVQARSDAPVSHGPFDLYRYQGVR